MLDPMHPVIPEVPSGPSTPRSENPPAMGMINRSSSTTAAAGRPGGIWSAEAEGARGPLAVRNPSPTTPDGREGNFRQLGNMVRRISQKDGHHHKVEDAAKNF
jgi:hypothetical protein